MNVSQTIKEIKELLTGEVLSEDVLAALMLDERKGVQKLIEQYYRRIEKQRKEKLRYEKLFEFEEDCFSKGYHLVAGIDEVGRGPLAGPVVAAAVILPEGIELLGINDSKQLSEAKREQLFEEIREKAVAIGVGCVSHEEIDRINIYEATKVAMSQAVEKLEIPPDFLLLDAMKLPHIPLPQLDLIKGDARSISIAAASIIAKVTRDRLMKDYDKAYPGYDFAHNAGYGTAKHLEGLQTLGVTPIHRKTFAPVKHMIEEI